MSDPSDDPRILQFPAAGLPPVSPAGLNNLAKKMFFPPGYEAKALVDHRLASGTVQRTMKLADVAGQIADGDLLLWRRPGLISRCGRGLHSHAGMAALCAGTVMCYEVREWHGGRCVTLASQVKKYPLRIDWFRANAGHGWPEFDRSAAVAAMRTLAGTRYGYRGVLAAYLRHLPFVRLALSADVDDLEETTRPVFCSHAITLACRRGGVDPVRFLADRLTEPADLARSLFFRYVGTLE